MTFSDLEDSQDCPLCCNELDITDRAVQFCGCGCESRWARRRPRSSPWRADVLARGGLAPLRGGTRQRNSQLARTHTPANPTCAFPVLSLQTRCASGATTRSWRRRPRPACPRAAPTAAPTTTRRRSRCSTSTRRSGCRRRGAPVLGGRQRAGAAGVRLRVVRPKEGPAARSCGMEMWSVHAGLDSLCGPPAPLRRALTRAALPPVGCRLEEEKRKMREKDKKPGAEAAPKSRANLHVRARRQPRGWTAPAHCWQLGRSRATPLLGAGAVMQAAAAGQRAECFGGSCAPVACGD